jgi:PIN domain nuclease of toxin-antitoxin system
LNLLLDTHVWLWGLLEPERLSAAARQALAAGDNLLHLSPISVWETLVLARKRRLQLEPDPAAWVKAALGASSAVMVALTHEVAVGSETLLDYPAADPADRFLVATALAHDLVMVSADAAMRAYRPLRTIW